MQVTPRVKQHFKRKLLLDAQIQSNQGLRSFKPEVDNGCTITCIHPKTVKCYGLKTIRLDDPILVVNADGTDTRGGQSSIVAKVFMKVGSHVEFIEALVLDIGHNQMLLGTDWLSIHNPEINWKDGTLRFVRCPKSCWHMQREYSKKLQEKEDKKPPRDDNGLLKGIIPQYVKQSMDICLKHETLISYRNERNGTMQ